MNLRWPRAITVDMSACGTLASIEPALDAAIRYFRPAFFSQRA